MGWELIAQTFHLWYTGDHLKLLKIMFKRQAGRTQWRICMYTTVLHRIRHIIITSNYSTNHEECKRRQLFKYFDSFSGDQPGTSGCKCCFVCATYCQCGSCSYTLSSLTYFDLKSAHVSIRSHNKLIFSVMRYIIASCFFIHLESFCLSAVLNKLPFTLQEEWDHLAVCWKTLEVFTGSMTTSFPIFADEWEVDAGSIPHSLS